MDEKINKVVDFFMEYFTNATGYEILAEDEQYILDSVREILLEEDDENESS